MTWLALSGILLILIAAALVRLKIRRYPAREGIEGLDHALAYDSVGQLSFFWLVRQLVFHEFKPFELKGTILDAGCGPGHLVREIAQHYPSSEVIGLDISQDMLRLAHQKIANYRGKKPEFIGGDVGCLPLTDSSVDFVVSTLSMHHWRDSAQALNEFNRVLKPGGRLLIMDLRRDLPIIFLAALWAGQMLAPAAIRKANGAIGSVWASYTPGETSTLLATSPFRDFSISARFGWMFASGQKKSLEALSVL